MSRWKRLLSIVVPLAALIALAAGALLWASSLMDSLFAYRSPLRFAPPQPGGASGVGSTRRLVFVLVDALREDTSLKPEVMPYLNGLRQQGAWATMHSRPLSYSEPGYATLLVGAWPDLHDGPAANLEYADIPTFTQDNLFSAAHRSGLKTAISGYYWFEKLVPQDAVDASFYTPGEDRLADEQVVAAAMPWLETDSYQLILIHLDQVDYAGHHEGGPLDPRWDEAARRADDLIRQIGATLDLSQDTLVVLSDHGQIDRWRWSRRRRGGDADRAFRAGRRWRQAGTLPGYPDGGCGADPGGAAGRKPAGFYAGTTPGGDAGSHAWAGRRSAGALSSPAGRLAGGILPGDRRADRCAG